MHVPKIVASLMLGIGLLASHQPAEAKGTGTGTGTALQTYIDQMVRQGWTPVQAGVLQRITSNGTVERFTYGEAGLRFSIQEAINRFGEIIRAYDANPTPDGAKAADAQADEVKRLRIALTALKNTNTTRNLESFLSSGCSFSFSYNADAGYFTTSQGVTASASASFTNTCGHVGSVYAEAYVEGRVSNVFTTSLQRDPVSGTTNGTNVSATASRTLAATSQCLSSAQAGVTVTSLGLNLSASQTNTLCPPPPAPPLSVSISGTTYFYLTGSNCTYVTWTAVVSGGTPGYSYAWTFNGYPAGTSSTYSDFVCGTNWYSTDYYPLSVTVTDSASQTATNNKTITVQSEPDIHQPCDPWENYPYQRLCEHQPYIY